MSPIDRRGGPLQQKRNFASHLASQRAVRGALVPRLRGARGMVALSWVVLVLGLVAQLVLGFPVDGERTLEGLY